MRVYGDEVRLMSKFIVFTERKILSDVVDKVLEEWHRTKLAIIQISASYPHCISLMRMISCHFKNENYLESYLIQIIPMSGSRNAKSVQDTVFIPCKLIKVLSNVKKSKTIKSTRNGTNQKESPNRQI